MFISLYTNKTIVEFTSSSFVRRGLRPSRRSRHDSDRAMFRVIAAPVRYQISWFPKQTKWLHIYIYIWYNCIVILYIYIYVWYKYRMVNWCKLDSFGIISPNLKKLSQTCWWCPVVFSGRKLIAGPGKRCGGFHKWGYPNSTLDGLFQGKSIYKWMMTGGTPSFGTHIIQ